MVFGQKVAVLATVFHVYSFEMCLSTSVTRNSPEMSFGNSVIT